MGLSNDFLWKLSLKHKQQKKKEPSGTVPNEKSIYRAKETINNVKRQPTKWEKKYLQPIYLIGD